MLLFYKLQVERQSTALPGNGKSDIDGGSLSAKDQAAEFDAKQ